MSKKQLKDLYVVGYEDGGAIYLNDYDNRTFANIEQAKKYVAQNEIDDAVIYTIKPVLRSMTRKIEWQDVESR